MDAMHICLIMGATTVSIKALSIMIFGLATLSITKNVMQPSRMKINIMTSIIIISIVYSKSSDFDIVMLSVIVPSSVC